MGQDIWSKPISHIDLKYKYGIFYGHISATNQALAKIRKVIRNNIIAYFHNARFWQEFPKESDNMKYFSRWSMSRMNVVVLPL